VNKGLQAFDAVYFFYQKMHQNVFGSPDLLGASQTPWLE